MLLLSLLIPTALALDFSDHSLLYTDAPFLPAEAAGISLLTEIGAVEGNPDGSFQARRTLNRAEFLKIALLSMPRLRVSKSDADRCFPDVKTSDWFSPYVCLAKKRGVVEGYEDGTFRPGTAVTYAEGVKILAELYNYWLIRRHRDEWFAPYVRAAQEKETALPMALPYDRPLTRGQMARLAAAFRAESEGELKYYRLAELGRFASTALVEMMRDDAEESKDATDAKGSSPETDKESSATSNHSSSASSASTASFASLTSASSRFALPESSSTIASAVFFPLEEPGRVSMSEVRFNREPRSIEKLLLVTSDGTVISQYQKVDSDGKTWEATVSDDQFTILPHRTGTQLHLVAEYKKWGTGFVAEELLYITKFLVTIYSEQSGKSATLVGSNASYPTIQTAFGRITDVENASVAVSTITAGENSLAEFRFSGYTDPNASLKIEELFFDVTTLPSVSVSNWSLEKEGVAERISCSVNGVTINCPNISDEVGLLKNGSVVLRLYGEVSLDVDDDAMVRVTLKNHGAIGENGSIYWTDGTGHYHWIEGDGEIAKGTEWRR